MRMPGPQVPDVHVRRIVCAQPFFHIRVTSMNGHRENTEQIRNGLFTEGHRENTEQSVADCSQRGIERI